MKEQLKNIFKNKHLLSVVFILLVGFAVRTIGISDFPAGLHPDEASIGYETYSLIKTGLDRNEQSYPVHFIAWGSGQNALYAYLSIPFVKIFGLNVFSVRLLSALLACISLLVFYLLVKSALGRKKALIALLFFAVTPWHIMLARWGLESNIFPAFLLFSVYFLHRAMTEKQFYYIISVVFFAISLYAYGTSYLFVPVFFALLLPYLLYFKKISTKYLFFSALVFLLIAFPIILFVIINHFDLQPIKIGNITIPRLLENRTTVVFNLFSGELVLVQIINFIRLLLFAFLQTDKVAYNVIPGFGTIYPVSLLFLFCGLIDVLKSKEKRLQPLHFIMLSWFASAVVLGTFIGVNTHRINVIFIPMIFFTVLGFFAVYNALKSKYKKTYIWLLTALYMLSFLIFVGHYVDNFNEENQGRFYDGTKEALQYCDEKFPADTISITANITANVLNLYANIAFYAQTDPEVFRKTVVYDDSDLHFRQVKSFDKYRFLPDAVTKTPAIITQREYVVLAPYFPNKVFKEFGEMYVVYDKNQ